MARNLVEFGPGSVELAQHLPNPSQMGPDHSRSQETCHGTTDVGNFGSGQPAFGPTTPQICRTWGSNRCHCRPGVARTRPSWRQLRPELAPECNLGSGRPLERLITNGATRCEPRPPRLVLKEHWSCRRVAQRRVSLGPSRASSPPTKMEVGCKAAPQIRASGMPEVAPAHFPGRSSCQPSLSSENCRGHSEGSPLQSFGRSQAPRRSTSGAPRVLPQTTPHHTHTQSSHSSEYGALVIWSNPAAVRMSSGQIQATVAAVGSGGHFLAGRGPTSLSISPRHGPKLGAKFGRRRAKCGRHRVDADPC